MYERKLLWLEVWNIIKLTFCLNVIPCFETPSYQPIRMFRIADKEDNCTLARIFTVAN
jgi:hypothetical protein